MGSARGSHRQQQQQPRPLPAVVEASRPHPHLRHKHWERQFLVNHHLAGHAERGRGGRRKNHAVRGRWGEEKNAVDTQQRLSS